MKNRKTFCLMALLVCIALVMGGCLNAGNRTNDRPDEAKPTDMPYVATDPQGTTTPAPTQTTGDAAGNGAQETPVDPYDWKTNADQVKDRIEQFSEIAKSTIVVSGNTALVGVEFDPQYRGELTERIRQMIAGVVMSFDAQVQTVAVTAETDDVKKIEELEDRMENGEDAAIKTEMDKIIRNTTTLS